MKVVFESKKIIGNIDISERHIGFELHCHALWYLKNQKLEWDGLVMEICALGLNEKRNVFVISYYQKFSWRVQFNWLYILLVFITIILNICVQCYNELIVSTHYKIGCKCYNIIAFGFNVIIS